jgi:hypothetical protein
MPRAVRFPVLARCAAVGVLCCAALACGDDGGDDDDDDADAGVTIDAAVDGGGGEGDGGDTDGGVCGAVPAPDPAWIQAYEEEIVGKLSGETAIARGVTLTDRQSVAARDATRSYILAELTDLGYAPAAQPYNFNPVGANVVATLAANVEGAGEGVIVVGAHFDGVAGAPAAADDGTGVALVLAVARWLRTVDCRSRDVIIALFDQEELGLVGSHRFIEIVQDDGGVVIDEMHNFDMISWDSDDDRAFELWSPTSFLLDAYQAAADDRGVDVMDVPFEFSDHQSFIDRGLSAVGVSEKFVTGDSTPHYHTPQDSYDKIDFPFLASVTAVANLVLGERVSRTDAE